MNIAPDLIPRAVASPFQGEWDLTPGLVPLSICIYAYSGGIAMCAHCIAHGGLVASKTDGLRAMCIRLSQR